MPKTLLTRSPEPLRDVLACPRCSAPLHTLRCEHCTADLPTVGDIPVLFADAATALTEWRARYELALQGLEQAAHRATGDLERATSDPARRRLALLRDAYGAQSQALRALLAPLGARLPSDRTTLLGLRTRLPTHHGLLAYEANVFRDWHWGEAENRAARALVLAALGGHSPRRILVIGAGAGRLAYDCHQALSPELTVALDINPLLASVAHQVTAGQALTLYEFPRAPRCVEHTALARTLSAPEPVKPGFQVVLGDALRPPFRHGAFDTVIAPWFTDIQDSPVERLLPAINQLLAKNGRFVHHGSLTLEQQDWSGCHSLEEFNLVLKSAGFEVDHCDETELPYLHSPASRHHRRESVITLAARKAKGCKPPPRHEYVPDWITDAGCAIPLTPAFQEQAGATRIHAFIMALIDGERSLSDLAAIMEAQQLMPAREAEDVLRGFLLKMWEEAQRQERNRPAGLAG